MSEAKGWSGSCHCGKVRFDVTIDASTGMTCNCSMCQRKGAILQFVPTSSFTLVSGADAQTSYKFNKHVIEHLFCSTCGVTSFARGKGSDGKEMVAINLRCLEGIELADVATKMVDGRSR